MTTQLDDDAAQGAEQGTDPPLPSSLSGGQPVVWAGGTTNVFESDYYWMYSDGWGGLNAPTSNVACVVLSGPGCWGHRDIILQPLTDNCGGAPPTLLMGAAYSPTGYSGGSIAAVLAATCSPPPADASSS